MNNRKKMREKVIGEGKKTDAAGIADLENYTYLRTEIWRDFVLYEVDNRH